MTTHPLHALQGPERSDSPKDGFAHSGADSGTRNRLVRAGTRSECANCEQVFNGVEAFDAHRVGSHGPDRRCLAGEEMSRSYSQDARGYWTSTRAGAVQPLLAPNQGNVEQR